MARQTYLLSLAALSAAWIAAACSGSPEPGMARGEQLFETCAPCHGDDGSGNFELGAPAIAGVSRWYLVDQLTKFKQGIRGADPNDAEGHRMRPMARTLTREGDVESVSEYVASLAPTFPAPTLVGGDATAGESRYVLCAACHGPDGMGKADMHAPALLTTNDWYMLGQLKKFKSGMRGANPKDIYGAQMRPMAMTLEDEQAMKDVLAFIHTLSR